MGSYTIPIGVTSIGESAFSGCTELQTITISEGITSIADSAFSDCTGLKTILISGNNEESIKRIIGLLPFELRDKVVAKDTKEAILKNRTAQLSKTTQAAQTNSLYSYFNLGTSYAPRVKEELKDYGNKLIKIVDEVTEKAADFKSLLQKAYSKAADAVKPQKQSTEEEAPKKNHLFFPTNTTQAQQKVYSDVDAANDLKNKI